MSEWIKCNDELPPVGVWVLFIDGDNTMHSDIHHIDKINKRHECTVNYLHNYTHWMELPKAP